MEPRGDEAKSAPVLADSAWDTSRRGLGNCGDASTNRKARKSSGTAAPGVPGVARWNCLHRLVGHFCAMDGHSGPCFGFLQDADPGCGSAADTLLRSGRPAVEQD